MKGIIYGKLQDTEKINQTKLWGFYQNGMVTLQPLYYWLD
jgi:hypothetical protein